MMNRLVVAHVSKIFCLILVSLLLNACASSQVSRDAAANIDQGVNNIARLGGVTDAASLDAVRNASPVTQGAMIGGAAGALTSAFVSGIGVIPATATGVIMGASYGKYLLSQMKISDHLQNRGIETVVIGDQVLIMIASDRLFLPYTATLKPAAYQTLRQVVLYINHFEKMLVRVNAYANNSGSVTQDRALTRVQAQHVAKTLLQLGVDARLLYAEGRGSEQMVAAQTLPWQGNENYRIEITLEKLHV